MPVDDEGREEPRAVRGAIDLILSGSPASWTRWKRRRSGRPNGRERGSFDYLYRRAHPLSVTPTSTRCRRATRRRRWPPTARQQPARPDPAPVPAEEGRTVRRPATLLTGRSARGGDSRRRFDLCPAGARRPRSRRRSRRTRRPTRARPRSRATAAVSAWPSWTAAGRRMRPTSTLAGRRRWRPGGPFVGNPPRIPPYAGHGTFVAGWVRAMAPKADVWVRRDVPEGGSGIRV